MLHGRPAQTVQEPVQLTDYAVERLYMNWQYIKYCHISGGNRLEKYVLLLISFGYSNLRC